MRLCQKLQFVNEDRMVQKDLMLTLAAVSLAVAAVSEIFSFTESTVSSTVCSTLAAT